MRSFFKSLICLTTLIVILLSCSAGAGSKSDDGDDPKKTPGADANLSLLSAIPNMGDLLPKSLQAGTGANHNAETKSRASGDVKEISISALEGVTANGYYRVVNNINQSYVKIFIDTLEVAVKYIEKQGGKLSTNVDYKFGNIPLPSSITGYDGDVEMDLGAINVTEATDDTTKMKVTEFKWHLNFGDGDSYVYAKIKGSDPKTMIVDMAINFSTESYSTDAEGNQVGDVVKSKYISAASYDASTGSMKVVNLEDKDGHIPGSVSLMEKDQNGYVKYYDVSNEYKMVAYANDDIGGVASSYEIVYNIIDGTKAKYLNTEYYDASGDLIKSQDGVTIDQAKNSAYLFNGAYVLNGVFEGELPEKVYKKEVLNTNTTPWTSDCQWGYIKDGATDITWYSTAVAVNGTESSYGMGNPVYMANVGGTPAVGDKVFFYTGYDETKETNGVTDYIYTYEVGFEITGAESYFGDNYYLTNNYLLKSLTLPVGKTGFTLKSKEGATTYKYYVEGQAPVTVTDKPANWDAIAAYNKSVSTEFAFWFENITNDNTADEINVNKGDIDLSKILKQDEFYAWSGTSNTKTKAYLVQTSKDTPPGFAFSKKEAVDGVKSKIEDFYKTSVPDCSTLDIQAEFDKILKMPDLDTFPKL